MENKNVNAHFLSLIMMLATAAWQQLGKIPNPVSGKSEVDIKGAQVTIDMLAMIKEKTKGNLSAEEATHMSNIISDLQLNYADEAMKQIPQKPVN